MTPGMLLTAAHIAVAAFGYRAEGSGPFPYQTAAAEQASCAETGNPAMLPFQNGLFVLSRGENPYGIDGLYAGSVRAGYASGGYGLAAGWSRFGIKEYFEDCASLSAGGRCGRQLSYGINLHADQYTLRTETVSGSCTVYDADAAWRLEPARFFSLGFMQKNIGSMFFKERRDILYPETAFGVSISPAKGIFLSWNYNRTYEGGINSLACRVYLLPQLMCGAGFARECGRWSVESALLLKGVRVTYVYTFHPYLGVTHSAGIAYSPSGGMFSAADLTAMRYAENTEENIIVDIRTCTAENLSRAADIDETKASRIIRCRELDGRVTEKTLTQMGLSSDEKTAVMHHAEGIVPNEELKEEKERNAEKDKKAFAQNRKKQQKDLFLRLIESGIPSADALEISQMSKRMTAAALVQTIQSSPKYSAAQKERICAACMQ